MTKRFVWPLLVLSALLWSASAAAQNGSCPCGDGTATPGCCAPETAYVFNDELVGGTLLRPELDAIMGQRSRPLPRLIKIRGSFINEMFKSVENL